MSYFNNLTLTPKGQEMLLSSNMNIDKIITFTNASLGSEKLLPDEIKGATEIKNSWLKFPLNTVRIIDDESNYFLRTEIAFTNTGITESKIMQELGIYAKFENEEEVLFAYSTTDDDGETIPKEDIVPATYKFTIDTTISIETKINQIINPEGFLTKEVIELLKENIRNIAFRKIRGDLTANQKVIQVPTDAELMPISQRAILNIEGEIFFLGRDYTIDIHANTITLNDRYNFKDGTQYEIIDPLPATYVKEQIQEFIDDFKKLVSDSKVDFDKLKDKIYLEFQEKVDAFYLVLAEYIEQNKEELKGYSIDRIIENGKDENGGNIYDIFRDDDKKIGTMVAPRGLRGNGIVNPNYKGKNENGDTLYSWILEDGTETPEATIMPKGENGKPFYIAKNYPSIADMQLDFETDNVDFGEYVLIVSENEDNGKLFEKTAAGFSFIVNMGGTNNTLTPATKTDLGGVIIGDNLNVDPNGRLSANPGVTLQFGTVITYNGTDKIQLIDNGFIELTEADQFLKVTEYPHLEGILQRDYKVVALNLNHLTSNTSDPQFRVIPFGTVMYSGDAKNTALEFFTTKPTTGAIMYSDYDLMVGFEIVGSKFENLKNYDGELTLTINGDFAESGLVNLGDIFFGVNIPNFDSDRLGISQTFKYKKGGLRNSVNISQRVNGSVKITTFASARTTTPAIQFSYYDTTQGEHYIIPSGTGFMYIGDKVTTTATSIFRMVRNNHYVGELEEEKVYDNNIPNYVDTITMAELEEARNGYLNQYNPSLDKWELVKTHLNQEGYYYDLDGELQYVEKPNNILKHIWNFESNEWEENATYEELYEDYYKKIDNIKQQILATGYDWKEHKQKCREKDVTFLGNAIAGMEDVNPLGTMMWAFSDMDIASLNLAELKELRAFGMVFVNLVYGAEQVLKQGLPKVNVNVTDYLNAIEFLKSKM